MKTCRWSGGSTLGLGLGLRVESIFNQALSKEVLFIVCRIRIFRASFTVVHRTTRV